MTRFDLEHKVRWIFERHFDIRGWAWRPLECQPDSKDMPLFEREQTKHVPVECDAYIITTRNREAGECLGAIVYIDEDLKKYWMLCLEYAPIEGVSLDDQMAVKPGVWHEGSLP